jgi:hypothetical protein
MVVFIGIDLFKFLTGMKAVDGAVRQIRGETFELILHTCNFRV